MPMSQVYSTPYWQSSFVNGYFATVNGTIDQPYSTEYNATYGNYTMHIGTYNRQG